MATRAGLDSALSDLSLSDKPKAQRQSRAPAVADSWEDSASASSEAEIEAGEDGPPTAMPSSMKTPRASVQLGDYPSAPPPTPASPRQAADSYSRSSLAAGRLGSASPKSPDVRPEKTTATASRMIAAGLGIKPPKRTEEQRKYDQAAKLKESRRREEEREAKRKQEQEKEKAKKAMWDD